MYVFFLEGLSLCRGLDAFGKITLPLEEVHRHEVIHFQLLFFSGFMAWFSLSSMCGRRPNCGQFFQPDSMVWSACSVALSSSRASSSVRKCSLLGVGPVVWPACGVAGVGAAAWVMSSLLALRSKEVLERWRTFEASPFALFLEACRAYDVLLAVHAPLKAT